MSTEIEHGALAVQMGDSMHSWFLQLRNRIQLFYIYSGHVVLCIPPLRCATKARSSEAATGKPEQPPLPYVLSNPTYPDHFQWRMTGQSLHLIARQLVTSTCTHVLRHCFACRGSTRMTASSRTLPKSCMGFHRSMQIGTQGHWRDSSEEVKFQPHIQTMSGVQQNRGTREHFLEADRNWNGTVHK